jgi:hypothetical protein
MRINLGAADPRTLARSILAALVNHDEACKRCLVAGSGRARCETGSRLLANLKAWDGRMDAEYADAFGAHDPTTWFLLNEGADHGRP